MSENQPLGQESSAVQTHLEIMQGVIQRMAENSRSCKVWCVTLVAAILVLVARTGEPSHALIALVPTVFLLLLDSYYLALERAFRSSYSTFVDKLHRGELGAFDVYSVAPTGMGLSLVGRCLGSVSIWLFYPLLVITILLALFLIVPSECVVKNDGM